MGGFPSNLYNLYLPYTLLHIANLKEIAPVASFQMWVPISVAGFSPFPSSSSPSASATVSLHQIWYDYQYFWGRYEW